MRASAADRRIANETFAPLDGDERGVAHTYFTRVQLDELLRAHYIVERLEETGVDDVAGAWAHRESPLANAVHWFAVVRRQLVSRHRGVDSARIGVDAAFEVVDVRKSADREKGRDASAALA